MRASTSRAPIAATRRGLGRRPVLALVVAGLALAGVACQAPVTGENRPTVPAGQTNGSLSTGLLVTVNGCTVSRQAANALRAMFSAAATARVPLYATSCYRTLAGQVAARESWCARGACHMAAVPGTSNHGWGKAVDLGTNGGMTFESPAYRWLKSHAWTFGWNHPTWAEPTGSSPEPWHWEWVGDGGTLFPGTTIGPQ